jgi:hypothetical protein
MHWGLRWQAMYRRCWSRGAAAGVVAGRLGRAAGGGGGVGRRGGELVVVLVARRRRGEREHDGEESEWAAESLHGGVLALVGGGG